MWPRRVRAAAEPTESGRAWLPGPWPRGPACSRRPAIGQHRRSLSAAGGRGGFQSGAHRLSLAPAAPAHGCPRFGPVAGRSRWNPAGVVPPPARGAPREDGPAAPAAPLLPASPLPEVDAASPIACCWLGVVVLAIGTGWAC